MPTRGERAAAERAAEHQHLLDALLVERDGLLTVLDRVLALRGTARLLRDAAGADADFQQAVIDYANARETVARAEQGVLGLGDFSRAELRATSAARTAQTRWNEALKARAEAGGTLADREKTLCDRRKAAFEAWTKVNAPARI